MNSAHHQIRECKICNSPSDFLFEDKILNKHSVKFYRCLKCNFIQTEDPHWLDEAYSSAICQKDTGLMQRNLEIAKRVPAIIFYFFDPNKSFLDYAGGYGIFVRMMRDLGFDFYWEDKFCENLVARGFEGKREKYELITSFESFEHFVDPISEISSLLEKTDNILFTTELTPDNKAPEKNWWYYSQQTGQHISFYSPKTFMVIAEKFGLNFYSDGFLHLLAKEKLTLKRSNLLVRLDAIKHSFFQSNLQNHYQQKEAFSLLTFLPNSQIRPAKTNSYYQKISLVKNRIRL